MNETGLLRSPKQFTTQFGHHGSLGIKQVESGHSHDDATNKKDEVYGPCKNVMAHPAFMLIRKIKVKTDIKEEGLQVPSAYGQKICSAFLLIPRKKR